VAPAGHRAEDDPSWLQAFKGPGADIGRARRTLLVKLQAGRMTRIAFADDAAARM